MSRSTPHDGLEAQAFDEGSYWDRSRRPLQALWFLMPMVLLYELGTLVYATDPTQGITRSIYARSLLRDFFELLGATGYYLPGMIVVVVLLVWHLVRQDPWRLWPWLYVGMWVEAAVLAVPLLVFAMVLFREPVADPAMVLQALGASGQAQVNAAVRDPWQAQLVFSLGAGIYEELLFRLIGITVLHMLLVDVLALPRHIGAVGAVVLSAVAFAVYHFSEANPFAWRKCAFYVGAGVYFAAVYVMRGFGIVAGTHAVYDVIVVGLQLTQQEGE